MQSVRKQFIAGAVSAIIAPCSIDPASERIHVHGANENMVWSRIFGKHLELVNEAYRVHQPQRQTQGTSDVLANDSSKLLSIAVSPRLTIGVASSIPPPFSFLVTLQQR